MEKRHKESTTASSFACEACASIRTVASLGLETHLLRTYHAQLTAQAAGTMRFTHVSAVLLALSQGLSLFIFALLFWYGGKLMLGAEYTVVQFFVVFSAMINGAQQGGAIFSFAPDMGQARAAAALLKRTVDRVPRIDHWSQGGKRVSASGLQGRIALDNVNFTYPGRPGHPVLKGVSLAAEPGQFIALVGASGSGKSTVMALLERFYDADSGGITVDGVELRDYNLQDYRKQLALVSQETTLYTGTVWENVVGGREDVGEAEVERACRDANVYEFIVSGLSFCASGSWLRRG
jgi:ATP-binding cassette subfamily B (MDR/TAP) protein 1